MTSSSLFPLVTGLKKLPGMTKNWGEMKMQSLKHVRQSSKDIFPWKFTMEKLFIQSRWKSKRRKDARKGFKIQYVSEICADFLSPESQNTISRSLENFIKIFFFFILLYSRADFSPFSQKKNEKRRFSPFLRKIKISRWSVGKSQRGALIGRRSNSAPDQLGQLELIRWATRHHRTAPPAQRISSSSLTRRWTWQKAAKARKG